MSGVGHALGVRLGPGYLATRIGQVGPRGAGLGRGRVGRAECGVGHAFGKLQDKALATREGLGIDWDLAPRIGQVGPRGAEWGRVGPSRAG